MDQVVFWCCLSGVCFLVAGLVRHRGEFYGRPALDALADLGVIFVATALGTFGAEHLSDAHEIVQIIPKWIPARMFWTYFVGVALLAAGLSYAMRRLVRWSSLSLFAMFLLFDLLMHIPAWTRHPTGNREYWLIIVRDTTFGVGGLALFASHLRESTVANALRWITRTWIGAVLILYGVEHILHPECTPGVPDLRHTTSWVPLPHVLTYLVGAIVLICGIGLLIGKFAEHAAAAAGLLMTLLAFGLYFPSLLMAHGGGQRLLEMNYVGDTLMFAGTVLLFARCARRQEAKTETAEALERLVASR